MLPPPYHVAEAQTGPQKTEALSVKPPSDNIETTPEPQDTGEEPALSIAESSEKPPPKPHTFQQLKPQESPNPPKRRRFLRTVEWILGIPLAVLAFVYAVWGPPWPTEPSFAADPPSLGSPFDTPFIVTNKSALFDIANLAITCRLLKFEAKDPAIGAAIIGSEPSQIEARGVNPILRATKSRPFTCPFRGLMFVGTGDAADRLTAAQIEFVSVYDRTWFWTVKSTSDVFTLNTSTMPPRWLPGEPLK
jgi:hypothetical protein